MIAAKLAELRAVMMSLRSFRTNDARSALNSHQGEISIAPASACERAGGGGIDGSGWRMWDMSCKTRFPPAESPPMTIFAGEMPLFRRCDNAALACLNWVGRGDSGAKARSDVYPTKKKSQRDARWDPTALTVFQHSHANISKGSGQVLLESA